MAGRSTLLVARVGFAGVLVSLALGVTTASGGTTGAPVSTEIPTLTGQPGVGKTLRTTTGSWSTSATFTYQWLRCSALYVDCRNIPGATAASYAAVRADVGHVLGAKVTATNDAGSASAASSGKGPVEARPPGAKSRPWIRGTKEPGKTLAELGPTWTRSPYVFTDQWLRCSAKGEACARITGKRKFCYPDGTCIRENIGTDASYTLSAKDVGHRLRVRVAAWNGAGRSTVTSPPTPIITS